MAFVAILLSVGFTACGDEYDDTEIWQKVNELVERVQKLEAICNEQNSNIAAIQKLLSEQGTGTFITSVTELPNGAGYTIKFSDNTEINIYNGTSTADAPQISVVKQGDDYYWTVNGEILKDADGNPVQANGPKGEKGDKGDDGEDGKDGTNGADGKDGVTPILKTGAQLTAEGVAGEWEKAAIYITIDGENWIRISANNPVTTVDNEIKVEDQEAIVVFTFMDGSTLSFPKNNQLLNLLCGKWKAINGGWFHWIQFSSNGSFAKATSDYGQPETGTFEIYSNGFAHYLYVESVDSEAGDLESEIWTIAYIDDKALLLEGEGVGDGTKFVRVSAPNAEDTPTETGTPSGSANGRDYIEFNPGQKWATCNLGATNPYEYGEYYTWEEAKAAAQEWGDGWRLPTRNEVISLISYTFWKWSTLNGVNGVYVTDVQSGNVMFLPAAGEFDGEQNGVGSEGQYWTSTEGSEESTVRVLNFGYEDATWVTTMSDDDDDRHPVRLIYDGQ